MIIKRAIRNDSIVAGGGACEMEVSSYLHRFADQRIPRKQQAIVKSFAKALEIIPRQLCDNAGFDATNILTQLRVEHRKGNIWAGVDFTNEGVRDNLEAFVWEPSLVKVNAIQAAVEAACMILSVDETISMLSLKENPPFPFFFNLEICEQELMGPSRKRTVRAATGAAERTTTRSGTEGIKGKRKRHAPEIMGFSSTFLRMQRGTRSPVSF